MSDKHYDRSSIPENFKELLIMVGERLDELLGFIEWLKTDQLKKGGRRNTRNLDDLSIQMEKVSRKMESIAGGQKLRQEDEKSSDPDSYDAREHDRSIVDLLSNLEKAVKGITGESPLPEGNDIGDIQKMLALMESRVNERESLLEKIR